MREYELVFLVADNVAEDRLPAVFDKVKKFITDLDGKKITEKDLGRRRLAYAIKKNDFATYRQINFELEGSEVRELEHNLMVTPEIIRHLLILRKAPESSILEEKIEAVANTELESVIGDRSFEQVEGETEESYDLMAKRSEKEDDEPAETIPAPDQKIEPKQVKEIEKVNQPDSDTTLNADTQKGNEIKVKQADKNIVDVSVKTTESGAIEVNEVKPKKTTKKVTSKQVEPEKQAITKKATAKKSTNKPKDTAGDEAERLRQLDEKLDEILGDDL